MKITKKLLITISIIIFMFFVMPMLASYGENSLTSDTYTISERDKQIKRVLPETKVDTFKRRFNVSENDVKIYKSEKELTEVKDGNVGTGMVMKISDSDTIYKISVIGDLDGDSKLTDIELNRAIKYVVGIETDNITGVLKESIDINNDGKVDHIDVTLIIRYVVYETLEIPEAQKPKGPKINLEGPEGRNGYYIGDVTATIEKATGDTAKIDKMTYIINKGKEQNLPESRNVVFTDNGEYTISAYAYSTAGEKVQGESKTVKIEKSINSLELGSKETESTIEVEAIAQAISGIEKYKYSIRREDEVENKAEQESSANKIRFENLQENTSYVITVEVQSKAGNKRTTNKTIKTIKPTDTTPPTVTVNQGTVTSNSIEVNIVANDEESGMPDIPTYIYSIRKKGEKTYKTVYSGVEDEYTFIDLESNVEYEIKVTTRDNEGNEGSGITTVTTVSLGGEENTGIQYTGPEWNNRQASITLSTETEYRIQYQKNNTNGEWTDIESGKTVTGLLHNDTLYARLWDGTKEISRLSIKIQDKTPPTLDLISVTATINTISIKVSSMDQESGMASSPEYKYYIKKANEINYNNVHTGTETDYVFRNLNQNTEYDIKVTTRDIAENEGKIETKVSTNEMSQDSGLTYTEPVWNDGLATITLAMTEEIPGMSIQWQKNGTSGTWQNGTEATGLLHGNKVYARLWDGTNAGATIEILVEDVNLPTLQINNGSITTNSIQVNVTASDEESGLATNNTYTYYIKTSNEIEYTNKYTGTQNSYIFTGLTQHTEYDIKVVARDKAGNEGESTTKISTIGLDGEIEYEGPTWSSGKASITLSTTTGLRIQYQKNGTSGSWAEGTSVTNLLHGDKVYARLWDGTNGGTAIEISIEDTIAPTVTISQGATTTNSIKVNVTARDTESGLASTDTYVYYIKKSTEEEYENKYTGTQNSYTFTGLTQDTEYNIKVVVKDKAGNEGEKIENIKTEELNGTITASTPVWSNKRASITLSTTTGLQIQYQKNGTSGTWTEGTSVTNLLHGDKVYARLWDGSSAGEPIEVLIQDKTAPTVTAIRGAVSTNSITVSVTSSDKESGMQTAPTYIYYIKKSTETNYTNKHTGTESNYTYTGLSAGTVYNIKVTTTDIAGNEGESLINGATNTISGDITSNVTWNNFRATLSLSTTSQYDIQWQKDVNTGEWTTGNSVRNLKHNDVIWVRLADPVGGGTPRKITIKDNVSPKQANISLNSRNVKQGSVLSIYVEQIDDESGINISASKWVYTTSSAKLGTTESKYTGGSFSDNGEMLYFRETTLGTYYLHILSIDNAGNKTETVSNSFVVREANLTDVNIGDYVSYTGGGWSSWRVLWIQGEQLIKGNGETEEFKNTQIVATQPIETISYRTDKGSTALSYYNNLITQLSNNAKKYINSTYASGARCFGSLPENPNYDSSLITYKGVSIRDEWTGDYDRAWAKDGVRAYQNELVNQSTEHGLCWTPSRYREYESASFGALRWVINSNGANGTEFVRIDNSGTISTSLNTDIGESGFVPVVILKNTLKLKSGDGTQENPWVLGT